MDGDALAIQGEAVMRDGEAVAAESSSGCCCGTQPCGTGNPECCIGPIRPPGCETYGGGIHTPRLDMWTNGFFSQQLWPPARNCCCGPAPGRFYRIHYSETVWLGPYPQALAFFGRVTVTAQGNPDAQNAIPFTRSIEYSNGTSTVDTGLLRVIPPGCVATMGNVLVGTLPPWTGPIFPTCDGVRFVWPTGGNATYPCTIKDGWRFYDCYHESQDIWSEIRLVSASVNQPYAVSHSVYSLSVEPNNETCKSPCPPRGACCCGGRCFHVTEAECAAQNGVYKGDGSDCFDARCVPLGRCCLPDNSCADTDEAMCARLGGAYFGVGTSCHDVNRLPCNAAEIAKCCLPSGVCIPTTAQDCAVQGGVYFPGEQCSATPCQTQPTGACCLVGSGCAQLTQSACFGKGGFYLGDNSDCMVVGGQCLVGRCCVQTSHGVTCTEETEASCLQAQGQWGGPGTTCQSHPCGVVVPPGDSTGTGAFL